MTTITITNAAVLNAIKNATNEVMDRAIKAAVEASHPGYQAGMDAIAEIFPGSRVDQADAIAAAKADYVAAHRALHDAMGDSTDDGAASFEARLRFALACKA